MKEIKQIRVPQDFLDRLVNENLKLKDEIFELKRRLKWIEYLTKGAVAFDLLDELTEGAENEEKA